ncbi:hypothetical protein SEA_BIG4_244 [Microbacterium phage Big4]|nr:hypothetical protein SEA_BIG4_244 [Microbacterium phage Big4]
MSDVSMVHSHLSNSANFTLLPCDKGVPNGPRSLHRFQVAVGADRAVCVFCGTLGPRLDTE